MLHNNDTLKLPVLCINNSLLPYEFATNQTESTLTTAKLQSAAK